MLSVTKVLEIRDSHTFIPAVAFQLAPENEAERYLMARAGYGKSVQDHLSYIFLMSLSGGHGQCCSDIYDWSGRGRTFQVAHDYLYKNWKDINAGDVIDVEYILGEKTTKSTSEAKEHYE